MSLYKQPHSVVWWVNISIPGHPRIRRSTGTTDRIEAQRIHDEIKASLWAAPKQRGKTWGDAVMLWCSAEGRGEPDILRMRKFAKHYKDRPITKVDRESLTDALNAICKTPGNFQRYRNCISAILNRAKEEGWIREVPKIGAKTARPKPRTWITHQQWEELYARLPEHQRPMALFAVETGLRQANVLNLTWDRIDLDRKLAWVEAEDAKAGQAIAVPLSDTALQVLQERTGTHAKYVFTYRGRPIKEIKTGWHRACIDAGLGLINDKGCYEGFTWHGLRHTWATWHVQNGTPLEVLQKLGGWSDLRMVLNYSHHSPRHLAQFANNTRRKK